MPKRTKIPGSIGSTELEIAFDPRLDGVNDDDNTTQLEDTTETATERGVCIESDAEVFVDGNVKVRRLEGTTGTPLVV